MIIIMLSGSILELFRFNKSILAVSTEVQHPTQSHELLPVESNSQYIQNELQCLFCVVAFCSVCCKKWIFYTQINVSHHRVSSWKLTKAVDSSPQGCHQLFHSNSTFNAEIYDDPLFIFIQKYIYICMYIHYFIICKR